MRVIDLVLIALSVSRSGVKIYQFFIYFLSLMHKNCFGLDSYFVRKARCSMQNCTPLIHLNDRCTGSVELSDRGCMAAQPQCGQLAIQKWCSDSGQSWVTSAFWSHLWGHYVSNQNKQACSDHGNINMRVRAPHLSVWAWFGSLAQVLPSGLVHINTVVYCIESHQPMVLCKNTGLLELCFVDFF